MRGVVATVDHQKRTGLIRGEDRRRYPFTRDAMVFWKEFDVLKPEMLVQFDIEHGRAINVERPSEPC
jgi:hypothetical protein